MTELLDAGKQDGSIRVDAHPGDFLQLTGALWRAASRPEDRSPRMLALILDGLRTQPQRQKSRN
ncbi:SbtR family transcriptional regulator [Microbispora oryzae]|uniref:SbtR family transcriptional regulator n=1 Tax=Microbispora oryzae TaxID=2806554 RepID=UPI003557326D